MPYKPMQKIMKGVDDHAKKMGLIKAGADIGKALDRSKPALGPAATVKEYSMFNSIKPKKK